MFDVGHHKIMARREAETTLMRRTYYASSHGTCQEGAIPSGARHRRAASLDSWQRSQRVEINYSRLRELCLHPVLQSSHEDQTARTSHDHFMAEYSSIFNWGRRAIRTRSSCNTRHNCRASSSPTHDISTYMVAIHGRDHKEQEAIDLNTRLKAMRIIIKKLPIQRADMEVKQLSEHLSHFTALLPPTLPPAVLEGVAVRALGEVIPKQGYSLPGKGGVYLILQGSVERISRDPASKTISSTVLQAGESFGELESNEHLLKSSYPMFVTCEACILLRVTAFDYERVLQNCHTAVSSEKQQLVKSCPLLHAVGPSVLSTLVEAIQWETLPERTTLLEQGQTIERVGFIQEGKCLAYAKVPNTPRPVQVCIGELGPGSCIGELFFRGEETQPYTTVSTTRVRVGWVTGTVIRVNEMEKHILSDDHLAIRVPTPMLLRQKHADQLLDKQWTKMRQDIVSQVIVERGITLGRSKWRHTHYI